MKGLVKIMMESCISNGVKERVSPFVYNAIWRKFASKVTGYEVFKLVCVEAEDKDSELHYQMIVPMEHPENAVKVCTVWEQKDTDLTLVLLKLEDKQVLFIKGEFGSDKVLDEEDSLNAAILDMLKADAAEH